MRPQFLTIGLFAATALAAGLTFAFSGPEAAAYGGGSCLRFRDLQNLTQVDDKTLIAHARGSKKYTVTLRHACREFSYPGNFYTVRLYGGYECFDRDDVLVFRYGGTCFIDTVTPIAPAAPAG
jgi:hypothetical protein